MRDKWKDRAKPKLDHIFNLFDDNQVIVFITGHLIIKSILVQMIDLKLLKPEHFDTFKLSFPQKTSLCRSLGYYEENLEKFLNELNAIRNKCAHRLDYVLTFEDAFNLVKNAAKGGIDFSDVASMRVRIGQKRVMVRRLL